MSMITVELGEDGTHEYASGITAGEVILNVHGKRSGAVAGWEAVVRRRRVATATPPPRGACGGTHSQEACLQRPC